jgi:hypothetical protein
LIDTRPSGRSACVLTFGRKSEEDVFFMSDDLTKIPKSELLESYNGKTVYLDISKLGKTKSVYHQALAELVIEPHPEDPDFLRIKVVATNEGGGEVLLTRPDVSLLRPHHDPSIADLICVGGYGSD